jgi:hypothetical protein
LWSGSFPIDGLHEFRELFDERTITFAQRPNDILGLQQKARFQKIPLVLDFFLVFDFDQIKILHQTSIRSKLPAAAIAFK